jgi:hypothetical protein
MYKFIFLTFGFLAWAFYEMSGGAAFEPAERVAKAEPIAKPVQTAASTPEVKVTPAPKGEPAGEVTRAAYTAPSYDLRAPNEEEIAALDPAVLASFASALNKDEPVVAKPEPDVGLVESNIALDLRQVTGNKVNMRNGPSTDYSVVARLARGDTVEVLAEPGNGWLKLRVSDTGHIGWMADFLVSAAN